MGDAEAGETLPFFSLIWEKFNEIQRFSLADPSLIPASPRSTEFLTLKAVKNVKMPSTYQVSNGVIIAG
jgi:hypothetical protein